LSADERQRVMRGEFVTTRLAAVSERDLPVALIVFAVTTSPDALSQRVAGGDGNPQAVSCSERKTRQRAEVSPLLRK
jgi:hypothetical protein